MSTLATAWKRILEPVAPEKRRLLDQRWRELPPELRTEWQVLGKQIVHCGYTMGAAYCSFGCTHCYLPSNANRAPIPTLDEMKEQIDANRRLIGENGGLQITGGDVVDAYWKSDRADELIEILRYADESGVVPMLMTHGQVLLDNPDYLDRLVNEGQLRKMAIHIDITQAGRPGFPIRELESEEDLHPLREQFVELILGVQKRTGKKLQAAHTVTVTERNLEGVAEIVRWLCASPRRLAAFRMVSFQTEADVGRTRFSSSPVTPESTWNEVAKGAGIELPRDNLWIGHPDCSNMTTLLVLPPRKPETESERVTPNRVVNLISSDAASRAFWGRILDVFGGVGSRGTSNLAANAQRFGLILRHPSILLEAGRYLVSRMRSDGLRWPDLVAMARGRAGTLNIVLHNFMSEEQVATPTAVIEKRLAACSFRGAVKREGEWKAVAMCAMNAKERESIYAHEILAAGPAEAPEKAAPALAGGLGSGPLVALGNG